MAGGPRRQFLKLLGAGGLGLPLAFEATAQQQIQPTFFLEVNLRVQQCLMHVMVPPGIAKYPSRVPGVNGEQLAMFAPQSELQEYPNNVFLTNDSLELAPHIDSVAMLDTGEAGIGGVHGLEAGNGMRSPGRVMDGGASGLQPMWLNDGEHAASSEELYGAVPTPAALHNYCQKQLTPGLLNGYAFKGFMMTKTSCYHFGAGLQGAEPTRIKTKDELMAAFGPAFLAASTAVPAPGVLAREMLERELPPYVKRGGPGELALQQRLAQLSAAAPTLELTPGEVGYWSQGVPPQMCTEGDVVAKECSTDPDSAIGGGHTKAQIWEQFAHAAKLFQAGVVRSIALEFDYGHLDGDGTRPESVQREYAQQIARPLARFITQMKAAGLYDRTVIAVYTLDGSRRPAANSYGNNGKGTIVLAGGKIKGGYYGDIAITSDLPNQAGHTYALQPPDPATGALLPAVSDWNDASARTPSGAVWRTVVKAMGIPESFYVGKFSSAVDDHPALDFMLKS